MNPAELDPSDLGRVLLYGYVALRMLLDLLTLFGKGDGRWARKEDHAALCHKVEQMESRTEASLVSVQVDLKQVLRAIGRLEGGPR